LGFKPTRGGKGRDLQHCQRHQNRNCKKRKKQRKGKTIKDVCRESESLPRNSRQGKKSRCQIRGGVFGRDTGKNRIALLPRDKGGNGGGNVPEIGQIKEKLDAGIGEKQGPKWEPLRV